MARKERNQDDEPEVSNTEEVAVEKAASAEIDPSLDGLVKMKREDTIIHVHPTTIHDHIKNGWKHA